MCSPIDTQKRHRTAQGRNNFKPFSLPAWVVRIVDELLGNDRCHTKPLAESLGEIANLTDMHRYERIVGRRGDGELDAQRRWRLGRLTGCHWNLATSGQLRKSHCPALYFMDGLVNLTSSAPEGCSLTLVILVSRRARISRTTLSPKYCR